MIFSVSLFRGLLAGLCGLVLGGCVPSVQNQLDEEKEPHFLAGMSRVNTMDYQGAIESFEKALTVNPKSASAHFELALLFDQKEPDAAAAIYHYQKYLKLRPDTEKAEPVKQLILRCKQELAREVSVVPLTEKQQRDVERLVEENKRLTQLNKQLGEEMAKWRATNAARAIGPSNSAAANADSISPGSIGSPIQAGSGARAVPAAERAASVFPGRVGEASPPVQPAPFPPSWNTSAPPARGVAGSQSAHGAGGPAAVSPVNPTSTGGGRVAGVAGSIMYLVKAHETLGSIARQHGVKLEALMAANPGVNPRRLRVGQRLTIPRGTGGGVVGPG
jgi:tetratricopeptide (TPR) repeat protein